MPRSIDHGYDNSRPLAVSRYVLLLRVPEASRPAQEIADVVSGIVIGTLIAMVFRLWAFKRFVFPHVHEGPRQPPKRRAGLGPRRNVVQHPAEERRPT